MNDASMLLLRQAQAFMELYSQILDNGGPAFEPILQHIRDHPDEGCLFHCTGGYMYKVRYASILQLIIVAAGKDRTAIIAAILLSVGFLQRYAANSCADLH